jgi:hypothetical protein
MGVTEIMTEVDPAARRAYEERIAAATERGEENQSESSQPQRDAA